MNEHGTSNILTFKKVGVPKLIGRSGYLGLKSGNLFLIHINITWRQQIAKQIITEGNTVNVKRAGNTR